VAGQANHKGRVPVGQRAAAGFDDPTGDWQPEAAEARNARLRRLASIAVRA